MSEDRRTDQERADAPEQADGLESGGMIPGAGDAPASVTDGGDAVSGDASASPDGDGVLPSEEDVAGGASSAGPDGADAASGAEPADPESTPPAPKDESSLSGESAADPKDSAPEEPVHEMTFTEHLNELRVRLVRCVIAAFVGFLACYAFAEDLFKILMSPLMDLLLPTGGALIYTGLPEAFFTHLKVAAIAGLFVASPYIFYQLWMFIAPGLYEGERKYMIPIALCSALCFVTGALFGYFVVFPFGFQFFLGYASDFIRPMPSVKEYFSFSTSMLFAFGFIFELPLFMFFLAVMGMVTHVSLRKFRKFAILGSFVVAAILTPPDVVSQCLMAGPLCLLYEIGIWVAYVFGKKPKEPVAEEEEAPAKG
jgi:sec-independent protein translocase protein TatC